MNKKLSLHIVIHGPLESLSLTFPFSSFQKCLLWSLLLLELSPKHTIWVQILQVACPPPGRRAAERIGRRKELPISCAGKTNIFLPWHRETWTTLPCGHKDCFRYISYWKGFYGLAWEPTTTYVLVRNTFTEQCELFMWLVDKQLLD